MAYLFIFLLLPLSHAQDDYLYRAMFGLDPIKVEETVDVVEQEGGEAEAYHWDLGTPDNIPEIEIIYETDRCRGY